MTTYSARRAIDLGRSVARLHLSVVIYSPPLPHLSPPGRRCLCTPPSHIRALDEAPALIVEMSPMRVRGALGACVRPLSASLFGLIGLGTGARSGRRRRSMAEAKKYAPLRSQRTRLSPSMSTFMNEGLTTRWTTQFRRWRGIASLRPVCE